MKLCQNVYLYQILVTFKTGSHQVSSNVIRSNLRKQSVHSGRYSFDLILMNQNFCHHEERTDLKVGHVGLETRSLGQIVEKIICTL